MRPVDGNAWCVLGRFLQSRLAAISSESMATISADSVASSGTKHRALPAGARSLLPTTTYLMVMGAYRHTEYFEREVLRKRPYLRKEWCESVLDAPIRCESQEKNRYRFWGKVADLGGRYLRVVTLEDRTTIHNAFPDRGFTE